MRRIRVLIADDHALILEAIRLTLEQDGEIEIVGATRTGSEVLPLVGATNPDLVLLDVRMPGIDGFGILDRVLERQPELKVVMLSAIDEPQVATEALERGAVVFLGKGLDPGRLAPILHGVMDGTISKQSFGLDEGHALRTAREIGLSERERDILGRVATGRSNREIATELWLSEQTVKYHLTNVYRKLSVSGRTEAARFAYEHGLVGTTSKRAS
jgi:DNA-binding NarL/FixJ family response regulator